MSEDAAARFNFPGLSAYVNRVLRRLAAVPTDNELEELQRAIVATSRRLEISLSVKRVKASQLSATARSLRAWIAFVAGEAALANYVAAVVGMTDALAPLIAGQRRWKPPTRILFRPLRGIYLARQQRDGFDLSLPTAAVCFDATDWKAVAQCVMLGDRAAKRAISERMQSDAYRAVVAELDALGGGAAHQAGCVHDLGESFDRVNAGYFAGQMARPKLVWSRSATFRKFGHYDFIADTVMLSRTLDAVDVPALVVDFIMFHELLHKSHGIRYTADSSRGYAHTADFYRDERKFAHHAAAEAMLKKLAKRQRRVAR